MDFYIGNDVDAIIPENRNVELIDELYEYLIRISNRLSFDFSPLCNIDPYDDVSINTSEVEKIANLCEVIIGQKLLDNYEEPEEGYRMINDLLSLSKDAISMKCGILSIGD